MTVRDHLVDFVVPAGLLFVSGVIWYGWVLGFAVVGAFPITLDLIAWWPTVWRVWAYCCATAGLVSMVWYWKNETLRDSPPWM